LNDITGSAQEEIDDSINSFARYLGSHDFYSVYVLNLCEGHYTPDNAHTIASSSSNFKNITGCGNNTFTFSFDLRKTLGLDLDNNEDHLVDVPRSSWPAEVDGGMRALETVPRIMSVVCCISLVFITIALALAALGIFFSGRLSACVNILSSFTAALAAGVASILATIVGKNTAELINEKGTKINISAQKGTKFLHLTWAVTICMLIASCIWCLDCIYGRRRGIVR
jgi:hypothetical protein